VFRVAYFGLPLVGWLLHREGFEVTLAVLPPMAAPGKRRLSHALPGRVIAAEDGEHEIRARLGAPDLIVSWYYSRRISGEVLRAARLGAIGAHPSLLPRHRGPNPFFAAIDAGDVETGVTVHRLEEAYDTGDMLMKESLALGDRDAWQLARALDRPSVRLLLRAARAFRDGRAPSGETQDESLATWAPEPAGDMLRVDWRWPTDRVLRRIRALSPVPGLALSIGDADLFVTRARETSDFPRVLVPGEAARVAAGIVVRTGDSAVILERAQRDEGETETVVDAQGIAAATAVTGFVDVREG
jgi:methionyl-tRNA formyltransferase